MACKPGDAEQATVHYEGLDGNRVRTAGSKFTLGGQAIILRGVNWFGFETENLVPHGLWARCLGDILDQVFFKSPPG